MTATFRDGQDATGESINVDRVHKRVTEEKVELFSDQPIYTC